MLKVHEDYESLGVGRYFSYKVQEALFNSDMARNDDKQALRDTMGNNCLGKGDRRCPNPEYS